MYIGLTTKPTKHDFSAESLNRHVLLRALDWPHTILLLPIFYGIFWNEGGSGGNDTRRSNVGDGGGGVGCLHKGGVCKE